jgi:hypothetical protein
LTNILTTTIKPTGLLLRQEIDLLYGLHKALHTVCAQLDGDAGITATNFEALCWTAIVNCALENSQGNSIRNFASDEGFRSVRPTGIDDVSRHWILYNFTNAWETLCEKLDADGDVADADYEANCYTAKFLHIIKDPKGVTDLGNGVVFYFAAGAYNKKQYIEWLYNAVDALETLTEQLDADGGVTDTDYEANAFTAYITLKVENAAGSVVGN